MLFVVVVVMFAIEKKLLFNTVEQFIKNEMCNLETKFEKEFNELKNNIKKYSLGYSNKIAQNKLVNRMNFKELMQNGGIKCDYSISAMPFDNINGFNGTNEYDVNGYSTKLLIASENIDPILYFKKSVMSIFQV